MLRSSWLVVGARVERIFDVVVGDIVCLSALACGQADHSEVADDHVYAICHMIWLITGCMLAVWFLKPVLLPILFAAGFAVLLEPFAFFLVDAFVPAFTPWRCRPRVHGVLKEGTEDVMTMRVEIAPHLYLHGDADQSDGDNHWRNIVKLYCGSVVVLVIVCAFSICAALIFGICKTLETWDWNKYADSPRLIALRAYLASQGVSDNYEELFNEAIIFIVRAVGFELVTTTLTSITSCIVMVLCLGFFLYDRTCERSESGEPWRPFVRSLMDQVAVDISWAGHERSELLLEDASLISASHLTQRLRTSMKVYIQSKAIGSFVKATMLGIVFCLMQVDLWILWTALTFVCNFVPLGSALATLAPLPFVFLDSSKTFVDLAICLLWPVALNNIIGNILEPRLFKSFLCLHPVTVLLALAFWTAMWGMLGAIICVPLTACVHVWLDEQKAHPYAAILFGLMESGMVPAPSKGSTMFSIGQPSASLSRGISEFVFGDDDNSELHCAPAAASGLRARRLPSSSLSPSRSGVVRSVAAI